MTHTDGSASDEVLFKAAGVQTDMYITTSGISYVFSRLLEEKESDETRE